MTTFHEAKAALDLAEETLEQARATEDPVHYEFAFEAIERAIVAVREYNDARP